MELIYDANNWLRRRFETGASVRLCYAEVQANPGTIVFDGLHAKKRRLAVFSGYKKRRVPAAGTIYKQFDLFRETCRWLPVACIRVPGWEADDVIATLARLETGDVHIKSTDVDFLQLPNARIDREKEPPTASHWIRLYKTMVGDQSDSIPGFKGFGEKAWTTLSDTDRTVLELFLSGMSELVPLCLPKGTLNWLDEEENRKLVRSFWDIVQLYDVPMKEILEHTTFGELRPDLMEEQLDRFML